MQDIRHYINVIDQLNEEVRWQKSLFDHLFVDDIKIYDFNPESGYNEEKRYPYLIQPNHKKFWTPVVPSMMERLEMTRRMAGCHVLGVDKLKQLIAIQGRRQKQISVFTSDVEGFISASGIWGGGGLVAILTGDVSVGAAADIMSVVDKGGRRLIDLGPEPDFQGEFPYDIYDERPYNLLWNALVDMRTPIIAELKSTGVEPPVPPDIRRNTLGSRMLVDTDSFTGEQKARAIKQYIDGVERVIAQHKPVFQEMFFQHVERQSTAWEDLVEDYDELVMGNFRIEKLYVISEYIDADDGERDGWPHDYFPEEGVFCSEPRRQCIALDFPVEFTTEHDLRDRLEREMVNRNHRRAQ